MQAKEGSDVGRERSVPQGEIFPSTRKRRPAGARGAEGYLGFNSASGNVATV